MLLSVAAGAALGLAPGVAHRALAPVRTFAFVSAAVLVFAQLLPAAVGEIGLAALAVFAVALAIPVGLERLLHNAHRHHSPPHELGELASDHDLGLELGYLGLLLHNFGDGLGVGALSGEIHGGSSGLQVPLSFAAHTIPVTALFVIAFAAHRGVRSALARAAGLGLSIVAGALVVNVVPGAVARPFEPWITAAVAGFLLHVILHDWPVDAVTTRTSRLLDLAAIAAGLALVFLGGHEGHADEAGTAARLGAAWLDLALETAPMLLLGLLAGAALQTVGARIPARFLSAGSDIGQAARGALLGAPLPVCACGVLPIAGALRARGAGAALVVAFLLATPELGIETFALTTRFLGWEFAILRVLAAPVAAIAAALVVARLAAGGARNAAAVPAGDAGLGLAGSGSTGPWAVRALGHFDELLYHVGAWAIVGLIGAAYLQVALPTDALVGLADAGVDVFVVSLIAIPSYVCAASATPLAAVLIEKGMSPGAVLAGLLLGPATNLATVAFLRRWYGGRAAGLGIAALVAVVWIVAFALNLSALRPPVLVLGPDAHDHGWVAEGALALLGVLILRGVWQGGLRAWLGSLGSSLAHGAAPSGAHQHATPTTLAAPVSHAGHRH